MMIYTYIIGQKHAIPNLQTVRTGNSLAADELEKTMVSRQVMAWISPGDGQTQPWSGWGISP